jgi:Spy/CpxP family protein refolding chaperone
MEETAVKTVVILFTIVLLPLALAICWERKRGPGEDTENEGDITTIPELVLTRQQVSKIRLLREAHLRDRKPYEEKMRSIRQELYALQSHRTSDQNRIAALQDEIGNLRDLMWNKVNNYRGGICETLTAKQRSILEAIGRQRGFRYGSQWKQENQDNR